MVTSIEIELTGALETFHGAGLDLAHSPDQLFRIAGFQGTGYSPIFVDGQWQKGDGGFDLVITNNETAPEIPVTGKLKLL